MLFGLFGLLLCVNMDDIEVIISIFYEESVCSVG